jgi:hypothetical protein
MAVTAAIRIPRPAAAPAIEQHVLRVDFCSTDGRRWPAVGGGPTVAAAVAFARESCPDGTTWSVDGWSPLYGD